MHLGVEFPARRLTRASNTLLKHGDLTFAIHGLGEFLHSDDPLDNPRSTRAKLLQPSLLLPMIRQVLQTRRQRSEDGADLDLVRPFKAVRL